MAAGTTALRALPSVDALLRHAGAQALTARYPRTLVTEALRQALAAARAASADGAIAPTADTLVANAAEHLATIAAPSLRPVVNASGVVLHTNLGRAVLADAALAALTAVAAQPSSLEINLAGGGRGERDRHVEAHLCALTGADAATVVNNNAAAVLLALNTLADGREVVVSRGELVEIGGAFRMPDVLAKSGALLREVGTTNRTHLRDYERAIGERTALLLKVHPSNYRIAGFTAAVGLGALIELGASRGVPVMEDLGSGALIDLARYALPREPVVAERVALGADVVTFSADKLLGGPQAGILVGRREAIERLRDNPLRRALRCDKLTLAALEATLRLYRTEPDLAAALPTLRWLTRPIAEMESLGAVAVALLQRTFGPEYAVQMVDAESEIGSGAQPTETLRSKAIALTHPTISPLAIAARFRASEPPIIGRVREDRFLLDLRCIVRAADLIPTGRVEGLEGSRGRERDGRDR
jgi:L-seryl-tRNA(Ser) seleniumtransferase